jgi:hypothetical protein
MNRLRAANLAGLMVALVSCSSAGTAATPTPSPTPTPPATPSATASNALPSFNLPSNAKELEALLPDTLGGVKLTKASMKGTDFVNSASSSPELKAWLNSVGKSLNDVSAAYAFDLTGTSPAAVFAFRVQGVDHTQLIDKLKTSMQSDGTVSSWTSANVGGKDVQQAEASDGTLNVYGTADIVFFITTNNATLAAEALSHLP